MVVYITVEGIGRVTKVFSNYRRRLPKAVRRGMWNFTQKLAGKIRKAAPYGAYGYMKGKGTRAVKLGKDYWAVKMPYYTRWVEKGTKAHFIPRYSKTETWARRHGVSFWAMKRAIAKHGARARPFTKVIIDSMVKSDLKPTVERQLNHAIRQR